MYLFLHQVLPKLIGWLATALYLGLFILGIAVGKNSCNVKFYDYFELSILVFAFIILTALPIPLWNNYRFTQRTVRALVWIFCFALLGLVVWVGGLLAGDIKLLCSLI